MSVGRTYQIFKGNGRELQAHLARSQDPVVSRRMWDARDRSGMDAFVSETDRVLHNYVASVTSLRDHTRRLWQKYPPGDAALTEEYERRVKDTFASAPLVQFIQDLRNYMLHRGLPGFVMTLSVSDDDDSRTVTTALKADELLQSGDWSAGAKAYLRDHAGQRIDLSAVVDQYTAVVRGFNDWFIGAWLEGHRAAFDQYDELARAHDALLPPVDPPRS
jgi:hypothetical protein